MEETIDTECNCRKRAWDAVGIALAGDGFLDQIKLFFTADADAVHARLIECAGVGASGEFHFVRNPTRALSLDARGNGLIDLTTEGDAVRLDVARNGMIQMRVDFS